jgi:hypothetical protein
MKKSLQFLSLGLFALPVSLFAQTGVNPNPGVTVTNTLIPVTTTATATVTPKVEVQATSNRAGGPPPALGLHRDTLVYSGAEQQFTIPCGATNVIITTYGASGANGSAGSSLAPAGLGGLGGQVTASWPGLVAGDVLFIYVGGAASGSTGGYMGGGNGATYGNNPGPAGGGGGATEIRFPTNSDTKQVAGGGGGGGNSGNHIFGAAYTGGAGGNGGGQPGATNYDGSNGQDCFETGTPTNLAPGAGGGTISAPGAAAPGCGGFLGSAGSGANGGNGSSLANIGGALAVAPNGGGGGGGYQFGFGGGGASGGTSGCSGNTMGGGGGGAAGSNYFFGTASIDDIGVWSGNGIVVIEYTIVADSASISAFSAPCVGQALTLSGTPAGGNFSVSSGPNDLSGNVFTASAETSYALVYTSTDGCGYTTNDTVSFTVACDVNSINEAATEFSMSPNPTQSNVLIQSNAGIREISVLDVTGKQLMVQMTSTTSHSIDISALPAGVYFVRVTQTNGVFVKQLIKE